MISKILVPVDGSASSQKAAQLAADWATRMGSSVTLIHVTDPKSKSTLNGECFLMAEKFFTAKGIKVRQRESKGDPAAEICSAAKAGNYDLIVMGSRGLSELKKIFMGSVSGRVVATAACPVTIVR